MRILSLCLSLSVSVSLFHTCPKYLHNPSPISLRSMPSTAPAVSAVVCVCPLCIVLLLVCNGAVQRSKDSDPGSGVGQKWRPQQAYGSNQVLFAQPQKIFSTPQNG